MNFHKLYHKLEGEGMFQRLESLYEQLPKGSCPGCGTCCYDAVPASFVEYMNIRRYIAEASLMTEALKERIRGFVLNELKEVNPCPFLVSKRCVIYPVRPITCRLFGFQTRHEQNKRRQILMKAHYQQYAFYMEKYQYALPKVVVDHVIPFCKDFVPEDPWHIHKSRQMFDTLMSLDAPYFISGQVEDRYFNKSLVDWLLIEMGEEQTVYQQRLEALTKKRLNGSN